MFKRKNKTKQEIIKERDQVQRAKVLRAKAKDELFPLLLDVSKSVNDAKNFCTILAIPIQQAFNNLQRKMKVSELDIIKMMDDKNDRYDQYRRGIEMFSDMPIADALEIINGMGPAIDSFIREENTKKPLSELKVTFLE